MKPLNLIGTHFATALRQFPILLSISMALPGLLLAQNRSSDIDPYASPKWMGKTYNTSKGVQIGAVCIEELSVEGTTATNGCAVLRFYRWNGIRADALNTEVSIRSLPLGKSLSEIFHDSCSKQSTKLLVTTISGSGSGELSKNKYQSLLECMAGLNYLDPKTQAALDAQKAERERVQKIAKEEREKIEAEDARLRQIAREKAAQELLVFHTVIGKDGLTGWERSLIEMNDNALFNSLAAFEHFDTLPKNSAYNTCKVYEYYNDHENYLNSGQKAVRISISSYQIDGAGQYAPEHTKYTRSTAMAYVRELIRGGHCRPFGKIDPPGTYRLPQLAREALANKFGTCVMIHTNFKGIGYDWEGLSGIYSVKLLDKEVFNGNLTQATTFFRDQLIKTGKCQYRQ